MTLLPSSSSLWEVTFHGPCARGLDRRFKAGGFLKSRNLVGFGRPSIRSWTLSFQKTQSFMRLKTHRGSAGLNGSIYKNGLAEAKAGPELVHASTIDQVRDDHVHFFHLVSRLSSSLLSYVVFRVAPLGTTP